jgi:hypothetical protein
VGTPDGVFALQGEPLNTVAHLTREDGLRANNGTSMAFSPAVTRWVGTNGGLSEIDPAAHTRRSVTGRMVSPTTRCVPLLGALRQ